jgi:hypothetical protein
MLQPPAFGSCVGENHDDAPWDCGPENPRAKLAPSSVGSVGEEAHDRVEEGVPEARPEENRGGCGGAESKRIGVKIRLEENHRHEDEVSSSVGGAVSGYFDDGEFLGGVGHGGGDLIAEERTGTRRKGKIIRIESVETIWMRRGW